MVSTNFEVFYFLLVEKWREVKFNEKFEEYFSKYL